MDNRGKLWAIDDDQKLLESPELPDSYFSQAMGRSENAIKCRRSHLAAKMHQNDPSTSLEEYVCLMHGDLDHALALQQDWKDKRANLKSFLDKTRKRKQEEVSIPEPMMKPPGLRGASRFFQQPAPSTATWANSTNTADQITSICRSIREEGGNLASVFNDPQFLPIIIQHYPGFEAYARVVQARLG